MGQGQRLVFLWNPWGNDKRWNGPCCPVGCWLKRCRMWRPVFFVYVNGGYWMILKYIGNNMGAWPSICQRFCFFLRWTEGRQSFDILWHIVTLLVYPLVVEPPKIRCFMACGTLVYWIGCPSSHRHLKNCFYTNGNRKWRNNCRLANIQPIEILIGFHFLSVFVVSGELLSVGNS